MATTIRIAFILLTFGCCCHLNEHLSSYFTFSYQDKLQDSRAIAEFQADTELACALRCNRKKNCDEAVFRRAFKKCSLYQKKEKGSNGPNERENNKRSGILTMIKVANSPPTVESKENTDAAVKEFFVAEGQIKTTGTTCADILQRNSSSPSDYYHITSNNVTWKTYCIMNEIHQCGKGPWTIVMRINGSENTFNYDSHHWTSQTSYKTVGNTVMKLPGYWLSNFNKICVTMHFAPGNVPSYAAILVNHSAQSLYSALNEGIKMTYQVDLSTIETPPGINKTCLVQGFNMHGQQSWQIKSRVGLESQPSPTCPLPYLVRGVGIDFMGEPITCGDIIVHYSHSLSEIKTYPAFCRIFTQ